jgi:oligopeptidase B
MKNRIKERDETVPVFNNGYFYYNRYEEGKQYYVHCRKKGSLEAPEEVLLDINKMAEGHDYFSAIGFSVSPDNKLLAYSIDTVARRQYTIYVKNLETGELYKDALYPASGEAEWGNDNKTIFYTSTNPVTLLSEKIVRHILGNDVTTDDIVYEEKDKSNYIGVSKTKSNKYLLIYSGGTLSSEVRILDADHPNNAFTLFQPRLKDVLYQVDHVGDKFLIVTNKEARNFRLMETPVGKTGVDNWKDLVPHRADVLLEGIEVFKDHLVITERKEGLLKVRIRNLNSGQEHYLDFEEPAYSASMGANPDFSSQTLRYNYTSLTTPNSTYDYQMDSKDKKLMKQAEVVGG